jgi:hypothetical protein
MKRAGVLQHHDAQRQGSFGLTESSQHQGGHDSTSKPLRDRRIQIRGNCLVLSGRQSDVQRRMDIDLTDGARYASKMHVSIERQERFIVVLFWFRVSCGVLWKRGATTRATQQCRTSVHYPQGRITWLIGNRAVCSVGRAICGPNMDGVHRTTRDGLHSGTRKVETRR